MPIWTRRDFLEASGASTMARLLPGGVFAEPKPVGEGKPLGKWPLTPLVRVEHNLNQGWRFFRPDAPVSYSSQDTLSIGSALDQVAWEDVNLPHTVRLEPLNASGGRNYQGLCWYRRSFASDRTWKARRVHLVFQAAMQVADVWLNGHHLMTHYGGYLPFTVDITEHLAEGPQGENILTLRLNNADNPEVPPGKPQSDLDFVYFGGLYRGVTLEVLHPIHISDPILADRTAGGGVFVTTPSVSTEAATVSVQTDLQNEASSRYRVTVRQELLDGQSHIVAMSEQSELAEVGITRFTQQMQVREPRLWHPEEPNLYVLHTTVLADGAIVDDQYTRIGIRTVQFDKETGLTINGKKFFSVGANRHQDHPYVGYALPPSAHVRDAKRLRAAGFTSYRSHYPQDPAFMDACDELGILAIVSNPGWQYVGDDVFKERVYQGAREMIRRDRNHPCVVLWEAQLNESDNSSLAAKLYGIVHEEFPGRDCYAAGDRLRKPVAGFSGWDVEYSNNDGSRPLWIREWGDHVDNWTDQQGSARTPREWGETPMLIQAARHVQVLDEIFSRVNGTLAEGTSRPSGADLWAGIDAYRGYHHQPFYGGPLDLFRFPKFDYFMFQSQREPALKIAGAESGPMVFIANFASLQSPTTVTVFSNCEEVRLFQNDKEVATQKPDAGYHLPHPPFTFNLSQFSDSQSMLFSTGVARPGTPIGEVRAEALIGGKVLATHELRAPGVPTHIELHLDGCGIDLIADGADWIRVYAHICDARGTTYPHGEDEVTFAVSGEGRVIGNSAIGANPMRAEAGIATALIQASATPGHITVQVSAFGLKSATLEFESRASLKNELQWKGLPYEAH